MKSLKINIMNTTLLENSIKNDIEEIDAYIRSLTGQDSTFLICIMNTNNQDDLTRLKSAIKICATSRYGRIF